MGQRIIISELEKIIIQQRYGMNITLLEQSDKSSEEDILQRLEDTFNLGPKTKNSIIKIIKNSFGKIDNKTILSIILPILISMNSCQTSGNGNCDSQTQIKLDGEMYEKYKEWDINNDSILDDYEKSNYASDYADSIISAAKNKAIGNFYGEKQKKSDEESGIEIKNIKFTKANEYSDYDVIKFSYKNNTGKDIDAISFSWYDLKDIFNEDIDPTYKGGYDDDGLKKGRTGYGSWDILERKVKTGKVYVSKIAFSDGSVWKN